MKQLLATLLALTSFGCSSVVPAPALKMPECPMGATYEVRVSSGLPVVWQQAVTLAVDEWSSILGPTFPHVVKVTAEVEDTPSTPCTVSVLPGGSDPRAWAMTLRYPQAYGTRLNEASIYTDVTDDRLTQDVADATMVHEMGHVLGLDHDVTLGDHTAMWPTIRGTGQVGCVDATALCRVWGCSPDCVGDEFIDSESHR